MGAAGSASSGRSGSIRAPDRPSRLRRTGAYGSPPSELAEGPDGKFYWDVHARQRNAFRRPLPHGPVGAGRDRRQLHRDDSGWSIPPAGRSRSSGRTGASDRGTTTFGRSPESGNRVHIRPLIGDRELRSRLRRRGRRQSGLFARGCGRRPLRDHVGRRIERAGNRLSHHDGRRLHHAAFVHGERRRNLSRLWSRGGERRQSLWLDTLRGVR